MGRCGKCTGGHRRTCHACGHAALAAPGRHGMALQKETTFMTHSLVSDVFLPRRAFVLFWHGSQRMHRNCKSRRKLSMAVSVLLVLLPGC